MEAIIVKEFQPKSWQELREILKNYYPNEDIDRLIGRLQRWSPRHKGIKRIWKTPKGFGVETGDNRLFYLYKSSDYSPIETARYTDNRRIQAGRKRGSVVPLGK